MTMQTTDPAPPGASGAPPLPARALFDVGWDSPITVTNPDGAEEAAQRILAVAQTDMPIVAIPEQFQGLGCGLGQTASAQRALAAVDPSIAVAINMHSFTIGVMVEYWQRHRDESWMLLEGIARDHALVASAFAEPGGSSNFMRSTSIARPDQDGYLLSGTKFPCSLASTAAIFCVTAAVQDTDESLIALCPAKSEGLSLQGNWESIGMRASDTARVVFENVRVDERLVFHRGPVSDVDELVIAGVVWFAVLISATYHGALSRLYELASQTALKRGAAPGGQRQLLLGRAARELFALGGACRDLAGMWESGQLSGTTALAAAMALRATLTDSRERTLAALTPVLGARLYTAGDPAAGLALDTLAVHHHPPNLLACDEAVGALHLQREMSFDPTV